ncbi:hypothetical protein [Puniceibacterium sp. IMCC21224]|uniref:hypothetical protein n=1 Tax=Puniceibacterium sp. IMCC21224 TaxID=1618204 RepID=UPI00064D9F20|nr:hypothetical protein [Puniceibacterium sp. IMCC21224]KMK63790.1 hypothetical protein IMCC21224_1925 [Puniceibacterium sp. IMCC21224]
MTLVVTLLRGLSVRIRAQFWSGRAFIHETMARGFAFRTARHERLAREARSRAEKFFRTLDRWRS